MAEAADKHVAESVNEDHIGWIRYEPVRRRSEDPDAVGAAVRGDGAWVFISRHQASQLAHADGIFRQHQQPRKHETGQEKQMTGIDATRQLVALCGDGRYRAYIGGTFGYALPGSWAKWAEATTALATEAARIEKGRRNREATPAQEPAKP